MTTMPQHVGHEVTILTDASLSDSFDLKGAILEGIVMPALWTAAGISFEGSMDDVTFYEIGDGTAEITLVAGAGWLISIPRGILDGAGRYIKIRSGTSAAPVVQLLADRVLTLLVRRS